MKCTITEALVKLKLADKKIADSIGQVIVGHVTQAGTNGVKTLPMNFKNVTEYQEEIKSRLDSVQGLIGFRDKLKKAIVSSNAATQVKVGTKAMTVAEAIEMKTAIVYKKNLRDLLQRNMAQAQTQVDRDNATLEARADEFLTKMYSNLQGASETDKQSTRKNWVEANRLVFVTHEKTKNLLESLNTEIEEFETNVDVALSVVNAQTTVEVAD